ncbi:MAG: DUF1616 domain-containing protein [Promethearchaeota archaeon]
MNRQNKNKEKIELEKSYKDYNKIVKISLILGIVVVSGFIIYYLLNPEPGYVLFGILNEDKKAENYPTVAKANESIYFYITVGNYLGRDFTFHLKILKGDNETKLKPSGAENAYLDFQTENVKLINGENWTSEKLSTSFSEIGDNQILIVELYEITDDGKESFYDILWLRLNITK